MNDPTAPKTVEELKQLAGRVRLATRALDKAVLDAELAGLHVELRRDVDGWSHRGGPNQRTLSVSYKAFRADISYPLVEEE